MMEFREDLFVQIEDIFAAVKLLRRRLGLPLRVRQMRKERLRDGAVRTIYKIYCPHYPYQYQLVYPNLWGGGARVQTVDENTYFSYYLNDLVHITAHMISLCFPRGCVIYVSPKALNEHSYKLVFDLGGDVRVEVPFIKQGQLVLDKRALMSAVKELTYLTL